MSVAADYIGRFAPSPSGGLHFGSLVTALAGYLQAKTNRGRWLLRFDDLDTGRMQSNAVSAIEHCLEQHELLWDQKIHQSNRIERYQSMIQSLLEQQLAYPCSCTRKQIKQRGEFYTGECRDKDLAVQGNALRLKNSAVEAHYTDRIQGQVTLSPPQISEDFVLLRRDGIVGYHLVSVADDIDFNITEVVRGADLMMASGQQTLLFDLLNKPVPKMMHVPVASSRPGMKYSKQNHAPVLNNDRATQNIWQALLFLGHTPPEDLKRASVSDLIIWAQENWRVDKINKTQELVYHVD